MEINNNGTYYPLWGTCLGFEGLIVSFAGGNNSVMTCGLQGSNMASTLKFNLL